MPPCVVVIAPPPVGTVHQLVSRGRIAEPEVRNHLEKGSVFESRKSRNYVALFLAVSKDRRGTNGPYVLRPATSVPTGVEHEIAIRVLM